MAVVTITKENFDEEEQFGLRTGLASLFCSLDTARVLC